MPTDFLHENFKTSQFSFTEHVSAKGLLAKNYGIFFELIISGGLSEQILQSCVAKAA